MPRSLAAIGRDAAERAQREALLEALRRLDWNLSAVAEDLELSHPSNVIRAIRRLGLGDLYEKARAAGKIPMGPRS